uniref:Kinesin motor domain-containing protein n=1 Tax=Macrostomum lignano TaxID=282301 RepID=A0A1I8JJS1_9PLAT
MSKVNIRLSSGPLAGTAPPEPVSELRL